MIFIVTLFPSSGFIVALFFLLCYWVKFTYVIFKIFEPVFISEMGLWFTFSGLLSLTSCCYFHENIWETSLLLLQLFLLNLGRVLVAKDLECSSKIPAAIPPNKAAFGAWHLFWDQFLTRFPVFFMILAGILSNMLFPQEESFT